MVPRLKLSFGVPKQILFELYELLALLSTLFTDKLGEILFKLLDSGRIFSHLLLKSILRVARKS